MSPIPTESLSSLRYIDMKNFEARPKIMKRIRQKFMIQSLEKFTLLYRPEKSKTSPDN